MDRTAGIPLTIPEGCDELLTANAHNFLTSTPKRIKLTTPIGNAMSLTFQPGAQSDQVLHTQKILHLVHGAHTKTLPEVTAVPVHGV